MSNFDEIYQLLQATPGLSAGIGMEKAMSFIRLAARLKNEVLHMQKPTYDARKAPEELPDHVNAFLSVSVDLPEEYVHGCWLAFKEVVWDFDTEGNACWNDINMFEAFGLKKGLCARTFYPPRMTCENPACGNSALLRNKDDLRKVVHFTLGDGACAAYSHHRVCGSCRVNYHYNFSVDGKNVPGNEKMRTYYGGVPDVIQIGEHQFMDRKVLELFTGLMLISWTSATNGGRVYDTHISDPSRKPEGWCNFSLRAEHVWDGFILLTLLEDHERRQALLRVPHGGDQKDRFTAAIRERNAHMAEAGQPEWAHYCMGCTRVYPGTDGGPPFRVIVVVTDGLTIGCTCCGVLHCIEPLPDGHGIRFCIPHDYLHHICAVIGCEEPNVAGRKTCANPIHMRGEDYRNEKGKAMFQLKSQLSNAKVSNPENSQEAEPTEADIMNMELQDGEEDAACPEKGEDGNRKLRFMFGRRRTHNEQIIVHPCGMIVARKTFNTSEGLREVILRCSNGLFLDRISSRRLMHPAVYSYSLGNDSATTEEDILEFIRYRCSEIRETTNRPRLGPDWPGSDRIRILKERADGLFVWASTACLYIESYDPDYRLNELIIQHSDVITSGPFAQLDRLYKTGLQSAGSWDDSLFRLDCCSIFGAILCARTPLSCSMIDSLLALPRPCLRSIERLGCVLRWGETQAVRILHPSFHDYLSKRSGIEPWSIDLELHNEALAVKCIQFLDSMLRENICGLTLPYPVQKESLPEAMSYACRFWVEHVCLISRNADSIGDKIYMFLGRHILHWVEALAIMKSHGHTILSLQNLLKWLQKSLSTHADLIRIVYDGCRFAQYFANTIEDNPLLIYTTALPFTPANTSIYERFYHEGLPKVLDGVDASWPRLLQQFQGHSVSSLVFSPDGSKIAWSGDETIRVWDADTGGNILPPLRGHEKDVRSVAFSPDGSRIVSGSDDKTIRVWDAGTGVEILPPLRGHDDDILSVAFSPDGSKIVSGSWDKTIRVWDAGTGVEILPPLRGHDKSVFFVAFFPDGSKIASGSRDCTVRVWDSGTGIGITPTIQVDILSLSDVAISPDGSKIATACSDKTASVWEASTGIRTLGPLYGHSYHPVACISFSPDGSKFTSGARDTTILVRDASTGDVILRLRGHSGCVNRVVFSPDGSKIVSASNDKTIRIWDVTTGAETLQKKRRGYQIQSEPYSDVTVAAFSPDASKIVSAGYEHIALWDVGTGEVRFRELKDHRRYVHSVVFSPDGSKVALGCEDSTVRVWDVANDVEILPFGSHNASVQSVAFSLDGSKIVSGSEDKTIRVWDAGTGIEMLPPLRGHDGSVESAEFSFDGSKIISGSSDKTVRLWDVGTGIEILPPLRGHDDSVQSTAFSPDGSKIVSGSSDKTVRLWDVGTGVEILPPLRGHDSSVSSVAFSPDGSKIISYSGYKLLSGYNTIRVWDVSTGADIIPSPLAQIANNKTSVSPTKYQIISLRDGWLSFGDFLVKLPFSSSHPGWRAQGSRCFGWTNLYELVIIQFPVAGVESTS